ncbi:MAG: PIN domain-containing protein [Bifidobacteriaceae bacterium]|nr:PIN domain-containing protein [Bifidobacteriaceae bacterium]
MSLLLDTMVVSELRNAADGRAEPAFAAWAESTSLATAFISVVTLEEIERGILLAERKDRAASAVYRRWLGIVLTQFDARILDVDRRVAFQAARYHVPDPSPFADALIAATAAVAGLAVATRNETHFRRFGVPLVNPWEP